MGHWAEQSSPRPLQKDVRWEASHTWHPFRKLPVHRAVLRRFAPALAKVVAEKPVVALSRC